MKPYQSKAIKVNMIQEFKKKYRISKFLQKLFYWSVHLWHSLNFWDGIVNVLRASKCFMYIANVHM